MALDQSTRPDPKQAFAAILPSRSLARFTAGDLLIAVSARLEGTGVEATLEPELSTAQEATTGLRVWNRHSTPPRVGLNVNGATILVEGHDRQAYSEAELARLDFRAWPEGRARIARTRAHVEILELNAAAGNDLDHNYDRAAALTLVTDAVTALTDPAAVVWQTSRRAMSVDQFSPLVKTMAAGQAPVPLWLGCAGRPEGARGAATLGLFPLLGAEIEVVSSVLSSERAAAVAMELVAEIFHSGEPPAHGAQLSYDSKTEFGVHYSLGKHPGAVPMVVLTQISVPVELAVTAGAAKLAAGQDDVARQCANHYGQAGLVAI